MGLLMAERGRSEHWPEEKLNEFLDQITSGGEDYRRLVERLPAIVYTSEIGERGRWRYVSPQVEEILGYGPEDWLADPSLWLKLLHPDDRSRVLVGENEKSLGGRAPAPVDYRMIARDGRTVWILDEAVLEPDEEGIPVWHGVLYDITERKHAEQELARSAAQQAVVAQLGERALRGGETDSLMEAAVSLIARVEGVDRAGVWEASGGGRLRARAGAAAIGAEPSFAERDTHAGAALDAGLHVIVDDWEVEQRFATPPALRPLAARSSLAVVIGGEHHPFGVLDVHSAEPYRFTPQDVHFVQAAANVLAEAIERHSAEETLRHRVLHDPLTGLPNRLSFVDSLDRALARATASERPVGVLFLDLDHFKLINDSMGHHAGDDLLRAVAPRLREHLRPSDVIARFGGDEFGVLVDELVDEKEALTIGDRVAEAFSKPFSLDGVDHAVTASIGIAVMRPSAEAELEAELLIRDADAAMYRAKERGRARCELFDAEMRARAVRRLEIERELRHALDRDELVVHYQPVVSLAGGEIVGMEALVRWQHPEHGLLDPGEFISVAEDSGLIGPIGQWVQDVGCRQALAWQAQRQDARPLELSINLSARQVTHRELPAMVEETLGRTGLDPAQLRLEVTESVLLEESETAIATLRKLHEIGVRLVLDDFGTGYSSLAYLNRFPFDALKIDRSFVDALGVERERTAIVEAIVGMARALSLTVVAEGVENETQLAELRRLGCEQAQGYLFSRPLPPERVGDLLSRPGAYSGISPGR